MSKFKNKEIKSYIENSKTLVLATIGEDNKPVMRTIGGFVTDEFEVYFSTSLHSQKVQDIKKNNNVGLLFEHENQVIPNFINVSISGEAQRIEDEKGFNDAVNLIAARKPHVKISSVTHAIFKVLPQEIKVLDFSKEKLEDKIKKIKL